MSYGLTSQRPHRKNANLPLLEVSHKNYGQKWSIESCFYIFYQAPSFSFVKNYSSTYNRKNFHFFLQWSSNINLFTAEKISRFMDARARHVYAIHAHAVYAHVSHGHATHVHAGHVYVVHGHVIVARSCTAKSCLTISCMPMLRMSMSSIVCFMSELTTTCQLSL
jgi:hypothetical protein